jgi:hypothetical protein
MFSWARNILLSVIIAMLALSAGCVHVGDEAPGDDAPVIDIGGGEDD